MKKNDNDSNSYNGDKYTKNDTIFPVKWNREKYMIVNYNLNKMEEWREKRRRNY